VGSGEPQDRSARGDLLSPNAINYLYAGKVLTLGMLFGLVYDGCWKPDMPSKPPSSKLKATKKDEATFSEVVKLIAASKQKAFQAVNTTLIDLYWKIGATISRKIETAEWGDGVVERLAQFIARTEPGLRGFTRRNLFRMRQFYEAYREDSNVSSLVTQLPWSHHLIILGQSKRVEEREFYTGLRGHVLLAKALRLS